MASSNNGTTDLTWINFCHSGIQRATTAAAATTPTSTWTTTTARACPAAPAPTSSSILETWRIAIRQRGSAAPSPRSPTTACVVERRTRPLISSGRLMVWISIKLSCYSNRCRYFTDEGKATAEAGLAFSIYFTEICWQNSPSHSSSIVKRHPRGPPEGVPDAVLDGHVWNETNSFI